MFFSIRMSLREQCLLHFRQTPASFLHSIHHGINPSYFPCLLHALPPYTLVILLIYLVVNDMDTSMIEALDSFETLDSSPFVIADLDYVGLVEKVLVRMLSGDIVMDGDRKTVFEKMYTWYLRLNRQRKSIPKSTNDVDGLSDSEWVELVKMTFTRYQTPFFAHRLNKNVVKALRAYQVPVSIMDDEDVRTACSSDIAHLNLVELYNYGSLPDVTSPDFSRLRKVVLIENEDKRVDLSPLSEVSHVVLKNCHIQQLTISPAVTSLHLHGCIVLNLQELLKTYTFSDVSLKPHSDYTSWSECQMLMSEYRSLVHQLLPDLKSLTLMDFTWTGSADDYQFLSCFQSSSLTSLSISFSKTKRSRDLTSYVITHLPSSLCSLSIPNSRLADDFLSDHFHSLLSYPSLRAISLNFNLFSSMSLQTVLDAIHRAYLSNSLALTILDVSYCMTMEDLEHFDPPPYVTVLVHYEKGYILSIGGCKVIVFVMAPRSYVVSEGFDDM